MASTISEASTVSWRVVREPRGRSGTCMGPIGRSATWWACGPPCRARSS